MSEEIYVSASACISAESTTRLPPAAISLPLLGLGLLSIVPAIDICEVPFQDFISSPHSLCLRPFSPTTELLKRPLLAIIAAPFIISAILGIKIIRG